ncbi:MAG: ExeM/NucH family extracellular endonuclease [Pseudomonadota bacterium]
MIIKNLAHSTFWWGLRLFLFVASGLSYVVLANTCHQPFIPIHVIQGEDDVSPLLGKKVAIEGVVSANFLGKSALNGFFVQSNYLEEDTNPQTSEGIFVYWPQGNKNSVGLGQRVRVLGVVKEHFGLTEITQVSQVLDCGKGKKITRSAVNLPVKDILSLERLESMRIDGTQWVVIDHYQAATYGQLWVSHKIHLKPTQEQRPSGLTRHSPLTVFNTLVIDDGSRQKGTARRHRWVDKNTTWGQKRLPRIGDRVDVHGVLTFSFERYQVQPLALTVKLQRQMAQMPCSRQGKIRFASTNLFNYFAPSALASHKNLGRSSKKEWQMQTRKIVSALKTMDADIIALMELDNTDQQANKAINYLIKQLNQKFPKEKHYRGLTTPNNQKISPIQVGLLYRPAMMKPKGVVKTLGSFPFEKLNRQPLLQAFKLVEEKQDFTVVVNHFKSKGRCPRRGADAESINGQGCWNWRRTQASKALIKWLQAPHIQDLSSNQVLLGDFNAYRYEDPIHVLTQAGFVAVTDSLGNDAYTYQFKGLRGALDHVLVNAEFNTAVKNTCVWHINANEMPIKDYRRYGKSAKAYKQWVNEGPQRFSDHDPIIVDWL